MDGAVSISRAKPSLRARAALKDVKRRWGNAQEDVFPVIQFEKLWGDMSAAPNVDAGYFLVGRRRGQQLKDVAQLDNWVRDGSREFVESLCAFSQPTLGSAVLR